VLSFLYNHWILSRRSWRSGKHVATLNVEMVATVLGRSLDTTPLVAPVIAPAVTTALYRKLAARGIDPGTPLLVVHPGSAGSAPMWPPEDFAQVAGAISGERGLAVVVTGVASEAALVERVRGHCPGAISLAGVLDLPELLALIAAARLVITN
jgi:ADP-heptose:LPS heptosyltransferase